MSLSRNDLLSRTWPTEQVPVDGGGSVRIKTLSAAEFLRFIELEKAHPNKAYALWWVMCVVDEQGQPLFREEDITLIEAFPIGVVNPVVEAARRLNRMETQETTEGNSGAIHSGGSPTP